MSLTYNVQRENVAECTAVTNIGFRMNKVVVAQEFVKAVNPALKSSDIDSSAFAEFMKPSKIRCPETPTGLVNSSSEIALAKDSVPHEMSCGVKSGHNNARVSFQRNYKVVYLGYAVLDRRYTLPMLPWVIAEIKRYGALNAEDIYLEVAECALKAVRIESNQVVFEHKLQTISKFAQTAQDPTCFTYMTREVENGPCAYHVFQATDEHAVLELFTSLREMTKEMAQQQSINSPMTRIGKNIALDEIMTSGQQYEVMYLGRIKVSSKRAPPTFIDDAVEKFRLHEMEKLRCKKNSSIPSYRHRHGSGASVSSLPYNLELNENSKDNELEDVNKFNTPVNKECTRISAENLSIKDAETNSGIPKSCSDPFNITAFSSPCSSENFIMGISPSISTSSFNQALQATGKSNTLMPPSSLITHTQSLDSPTCADIVQDLNDIKSNLQPRDRALSTSGSFGMHHNPVKQVSLPAYRHRTGSGGSNDMRRPRAFTSPAQSSNQQQRNRTMLFLIGKTELCLIGMDKKQALLSKTFNDIAHCSQGTKHLDHFGFICREIALAGADFYAGYIFRCQTEKVVDEIMQSLRLAFKKAHQDYLHTPLQPKAPSVPRIVICESCPMQWLHRLCSDIEGLPPEETHCAILTKLHTLPDCDRLDIMSKCEDADVNCLQEQNEVIMMYLRKFCEQRQMKHVHLNNGTCNKNDMVFLKDKSNGPSKLDNFRQKAKKSLSNSFETILKRKHRDDVRERSLTSISDNTIADLVTLKDDELLEMPYREGSYDGIETTKSVSLQQRPRSSTFSTTNEVRKANKKKNSHHKNSPPQTKSPIMNMFMKIGNQNHTPYSSEDESESPSRKGSWRQAIFHRVQTPINTPKSTPCKPERSTEEQSCENLAEIPKKKTKEQLRALWRKAILEEILLIRMEKENKKLQVNQDAASHKRMKLDYEDITPCLRDSVLMWDELLNNPERPHFHIENVRLQGLVKAGVPRNRRGEIWQFLAEQHNLNSPTYANVEQLDVPYEDLLRQLTSHQHAILIDLGRTFPNHPFFSQPLGSGQLSLFNLLKAYSLLDGEVGYCQGLSFVSGILLLHMPEEQAFQMMKHILFHLGFRRQYMPDMVALQIQMYQLSRLIHDSHRDLYDHLEKYDIAPTLYAAPWFLTLFASQFPLGFVSRLFDLIFLQGLETIFKVSLILLRNQKDAILQCHGFEAIMEFLKTGLTSMNMVELQIVFNQVFTLDISQQLHAYEVEYHVLKEEMMYSPSRVDTELVQKMEIANRNLKIQNMQLIEQLQVAYSTIHNLQSSESSYKSTVLRLENRVRALEDEKEVLMHSLNVMRKRLQKLEMAACAEDESEETEGDDHRPPSFQVVYALAGSEKDEDMQLKQLIKDFCDRRDSQQSTDKDILSTSKEQRILNDVGDIAITVSSPDENSSPPFENCDHGDFDLISWNDPVFSSSNVKNQKNEDLISY